MINYTHTAACTLPLPLSLSLKATCKYTRAITGSQWTCVSVVCVLYVCWSVVGGLVGGPGF